MASTEKSIAQLAQELKEPENRIRYLIGREHIVESRCVGNCRVYDEKAQGLIKEALHSIQIQKTG